MQTIYGGESRREKNEPSHLDSHGKSLGSKEDWAERVTDSNTVQRKVEPSQQGALDPKTNGRGLAFLKKWVCFQGHAQPLAESNSQQCGLSIKAV